MKRKKFLIVFSFLLVLILSLTACYPFEDNGDVDPNDYNKYFSKIGFSNSVDNYTHKEMSIDNFTNGSLWELEQDYYTGMQLCQKVQVRIRKIGFWVKADKPCELTFRFKILMRKRTDLINTAEDPEIKDIMLHVVLEKTQTIQVSANSGTYISFEFDDVVLRNSDDDSVEIEFTNNRNSVDGNFTNTQDVKITIDDITLNIVKGG